MPYVSSIFTKLVSAITIVMPSSDGTRITKNYYDTRIFSANDNLSFHLG